MERTVAGLAADQRSSVGIDQLVHRSGYQEDTSSEEMPLPRGSIPHDPTLLSSCSFLIP